MHLIHLTAASAVPMTGPSDCGALLAPFVAGAAAFTVATAVAIVLHVRRRRTRTARVDSAVNQAVALRCA